MLSENEGDGLSVLKGYLAEVIPGRLRGPLLGCHGATPSNPHAVVPVEWRAS